VTPILALLAALSAAPPPGMAEAGLRAATEHRYCDASLIFTQLHGHTRDALVLYRAAETAYAADDRLAALRLYRTLLDTHADFDRRAVVEQRIAELLTLVREKGPGQTCAVPPRVCGDWIVSAGEACDDGNLVDGDGCDGTCLPSGCGNGAVSGDEVCDDGNPINGDGCDDNCTASACGNGVVGPGERCDDGNDVDGDGCDHTCTPSSCGNGIRAGDEACDDGNIDNGDGCSARCRVEAPPSPLPGLFGASGGGAVLVGGLLAGVGSLPYFAHGQARQDVQDAEALARVDADVGLRDAAQAQERQTAARADWETWGLPATVAGLAVGAVGVVMAGLGGAMALGIIDLSEELPYLAQQAPPAETPKPPEPPSTTPKPPSPSTTGSATPAPLEGSAP
jgi:cysteine-rich repeat protein